LRNSLGWQRTLEFGRYATEILLPLWSEARFL